MYWGYMSFEDGTEVTYSETREDGTVGVWVETPVEGGFNSAHCWLPGFRWDVVRSYSAEAMEWIDTLIKNNAIIILDMSEEKTFPPSRSNEA